MIGGGRGWILDAIFGEASVPASIVILAFIIYYYIRQRLYADTPEEDRRKAALKRQLQALDESKGYCGRMRTHHTVEDFRKRFKERIGQNPPGFFGKITEENTFILWNLKEPTINEIQHTSLAGRITPEGEITYRISGTTIFQVNRIEREKLEEKLLELCK